MRKRKYYKNKFCACGCGGQIEIKPSHKYCGVSKYISGHNTRGQEKPKNSGRKRFPRETRVCAYSECDNAFECIIISKQKYCCISHSRIGKYPSEETKRNISVNLSNRWQDIEFRRKQSKSHTGLHPTEETIKKIIKSNTGKVRTEETKRKNSEAKKGSKHPNWQGGITEQGYPFNFNEELKELIRNRDNYTCQLCGKPQKESKRKLDVHHIDYIKENLDPNNLLTLCSSCNVKVNFNRRAWTKFFRLKLKFSA